MLSSKIITEPTGSFKDLCLPNHHQLWSLWTIVPNVTYLNKMSAHKIVFILKARCFQQGECTVTEKFREVPLFVGLLEKRGRCLPASAGQDTSLLLTSTRSCSPRLGSCSSRGQHTTTTIRLGSHSAPRPGKWFCWTPQRDPSRGCCRRFVEWSEYLASYLHCSWYRATLLSIYFNSQP